MMMSSIFLHLFTYLLFKLVVILKCTLKSEIYSLIKGEHYNLNNPLSLPIYPYHHLLPIVTANFSYTPGTMPRLMEQNYLHPTWNQPQNWTPPAPLILS